jgi:hypothetical protein
MAALARERVGSVRAVTRDLRPMTAAVKAWKGGLVAAKAGFYKPAVLEAGARIVGRFAQTVDNTGAAGAKSVDVHFLQERNLILLANSAANPVTAAMRETVCYAEDDQTVGSLATGMSVAGIVYDVTAEGVWVEIGAKS